MRSERVQVATSDKRDIFSSARPERCGGATPEVVPG